MIAKGVMSSFMKKSVRYFSQANKGNVRAAVVLSGCGVFDGSEITESVAMMIALSRNNCSVEYFAPDMDQFHVIDHVNGNEIDQHRNVLVESARITRGLVRPLSNLKVTDFHAIFFPGGFGAAKNLSTFGQDGKEMTVLEDVQRILEEARENEVNIGMCCISPILAAKVSWSFDEFPRCSARDLMDQELHLPLE